MAALIAPSILSADFSRLADELADVERAGCDWIHVDVMDGHFVPNLTIGPVVVKHLRPHTKLPLDCHLMVSEPEKWIQPFAQAGADVITVHVETVSTPGVLKSIRGLGKKAGLSLNPATPVTALVPFLDDVDLVLVMSVQPGFGGQAFMPAAFTRIQELVAIRNNRPFLIEVDGGVSGQNIKQLRQSGADVFVAGNSIFGKADRNKAISELRSLAQ